MALSKEFVTMAIKRRMAEVAELMKACEEPVEWMTIAINTEKDYCSFYSFNREDDRKVIKYITFNLTKGESNEDLH